MYVLTPITMVLSCMKRERVGVFIVSVKGLNTNRYMYASYCSRFYYGTCTCACTCTHMYMYMQYVYILYTVKNARISCREHQSILSPTGWPDRHQDRHCRPSVSSDSDLGWERNGLTVVDYMYLTFWRQMYIKNTPYIRSMLAEGCRYKYLPSRHLSPKACSGNIVLLANKKCCMHCTNMCTHWKITHLRYVILDICWRKKSKIIKMYDLW